MRFGVRDGGGAVMHCDCPEIALVRAKAEVPPIKKWFEESGLEVPMSSPAELTAFMQADIEKWVQVAKDNNLKIEMQ